MDVCEVVQAITAGRILLAVEATRQSRAVIAAAIKRALQSHAEVLVLSVRERDYTRGIAWDVRPAGEIAEVVSHAIYELQRVGVPARGLIRTARSGRVADEILYAAYKHHADEIVIGKSERSWIGRVLYGSVSPRVLRLAEVPVTAVPTRKPAGASAQPARPHTPRATRTPRPR